MRSVAVHRVLVVVAVALSLLALPLSVLAQATPSPVANPAEAIQRGAEWLVSQQVDDGAWVGFSGTSDPGVTIDAVIALAAARSTGVDVDLTSAVAYLQANGKVYAESGAGAAAKLALSDTAYKVDVWLSLGVIGLILATSIAASLFATRRQAGLGQPRPEASAP